MPNTTPCVQVCIWPAGSIPGLSKCACACMFVKFTHETEEILVRGTVFLKRSKEQV